MSRINILNSVIHNDNLSCGWDVNGNCYFVLLEGDNDEEPDYYSPLIDSIDGVDEAFSEVDEIFPAILREALINQRMAGDEQSYFFDAKVRGFVSSEDFEGSEEW